MPFTIKQINEFVPKKGRYDNINLEDPSQNNVMANMRLLYNELGELVVTGNELGIADLRKALKNTMDSADGLIKPEEGQAAINALETWTSLVSSFLDPEVAKNPEKYVKDADKRARIKNLIDHVTAGLELEPKFTKYTPTQEIKDAAAKKREADRKALKESAEIEAQEALERLKQQAANGGKKPQEAEPKKKENATLNGRTVLDDLIAQGKSLPKRPQTMEQMSQLADQARDLCLDIMATRRTIGALRNQPKLLNKDFNAADQDKWKENLKKSTSLKQFLQNLSYDELRKLASDGHGGALEDKFKEYTVKNFARINDNNLIFVDQNLPEEYRPTALQYTEHLQTRQKYTESFFPKTKRDFFIRLMAARAAVDSVRGNKKSLDAKIDPKRMVEAMMKFQKEPLKTALDRTISRNYANDAPEAFQEGHGGALEDIVREEVRKMSVESKGGAMVNADKRYAPTYAQRMADIERMLKSNQLTDDQKLERTVEAMLLYQRKDFDEKGARIGDTADLNKKAADTVKFFKSATNNKLEYDKLIESIKDPNLPLESKLESVGNFRENHRGQIMAMEKEAEIKESLKSIQKLTQGELEYKAAQKLAIQTSLFKYNQSAHEELKREFPNTAALSMYQGQLADDLGSKFNKNVSKIEKDEAFKYMCSNMKKEELAEALGKDGFELAGKYAEAQKFVEDMKKEGHQPAKEPVKEGQANKQEEIKVDDQQLII